MMPVWAWWGLTSIGLFAVGWLYGRLSQSPAPAGRGPWDTSWAVYFSPNGGATHAIIEGIRSAQQTILVQAYLLYSTRLAGALVCAHLKNGESRTISIAPETVVLLRRHKAHQAELKLANRTHSRDHGLVFAKEQELFQRLGGTLGHPLPMNSLGQQKYARIKVQAGVRGSNFTACGILVRRYCCRREFLSKWCRSDWAINKFRSRGYLCSCPPLDAAGCGSQPRGLAALLTTCPTSGTVGL
jgi:DNA-directed RNA polymerase subunit N (RpoN/RPB10)